MIAAICLGFFGSIFALIGMKCTRIGGSDKIKARIAFFAGFNFILSGNYMTSNKLQSETIFYALPCLVDILSLVFVVGLCSLTACSLYAHKITSEFFDPMFVAQK